VITARLLRKNRHTRRFPGQCELKISAEAVEKGICPVISVQFPSSSIQPKTIYNQL